MNPISKVTCVIVLLSSILLILATGRSNIKNFEKVQVSIEEIFKDRLVVKGLILNLNNLVYKKEIAIVSNDLSYYKELDEITNNKIEMNLKKFRQTYLTNKEEKTLNHFEREVQKLKEREVRLVSTNKNLSKTEIESLTSQIGILHNDLKELSKIQINEGQRKLDKSGNAVESMYKYESFENFAVIILGIMIIIVIFVPGVRENNKD